MTDLPLHPDAAGYLINALGTLHVANANLDSEIKSLKLQIEALQVQVAGKEHQAKEINRLNLIIEHLTKANGDLDAKLHSNRAKRRV